MTSDRALWVVLSMIGAVLVFDAAGCRRRNPPIFASTRQLDYGVDFQQSANYTALNRRGDNSNSEAQCYLPARIGLSSGLLTITAEVSTQTCSDTTNGSASFNYSSGFVQWPTARSFTSGTLCIRARVAGGTGPWPAIWLLGSSCQGTNPNTADNTGACIWPNISNNSDEIDIAEFLGANFTSVNQQIHANDGTNNNTGICAAQCSPSVTDASLNFHNYCLVRVAGTSLTWTIDGATTCTKTSCISSTPMGLMIDVAMGGTGGGTISNGTLPQTLQVAWVTMVQ